MRDPQQGQDDRVPPGLLGESLPCIDQHQSEVDERAEWLRAQGAEIESGPAEYDYREGYYAVFFYDPDGIKLELLYVPT